MMVSVAYCYNYSDYDGAFFASYGSDPGFGYCDGVDERVDEGDDENEHDCGGLSHTTPRLHAIFHRSCEENVADAIQIHRGAESDCVERGS